MTDNKYIILALSMSHLPDSGHYSCTLAAAHHFFPFHGAVPIVLRDSRGGLLTRFTLFDRYIEPGHRQQTPPWRVLLICFVPLLPKI